MNPQSWWRVEVDADGKAHTVVRVDSKPENSGCGVLYVLAVDERHARQEAYRLAQRIRARERRAQYEAEGKCRCGRPREDAAFRKCRTCRQRNRHDDQVSRTRAKGIEVPKVSKALAHAERRGEERQRARVELLRELLKELEGRTEREAVRWIKSKLLAESRRAA